MLAKTASGRGLPTLVAGHEPIDAGPAVELSRDALDALAPHGVIDVLRPYATIQEPFAIAPLLFEQGLKHHCVADMLITIFDDMTYRESGGVGQITDGSSTWDVSADTVIDVSEFPTELNDAIVAAAARANSLVDALASEG